MFSYGLPVSSNRRRKLARRRCACPRLSPTEISIPRCSRTKCYRFLLPVGVFRVFFRKSGEVSPLESLAAPQGFEPRYADPESAVLPLNEGAVFCEMLGDGKSLCLRSRGSLCNSKM